MPGKLVRQKHDGGEQGVGFGATAEREQSPLGRAGGLAVYPLATLWLLVGMAFVAEEYFSVALEGIVEKYHVPDAVAGATVLAVQGRGVVPRVVPRGYYGQLRVL